MSGKFRNATLRGGAGLRASAAATALLLSGTPVFAASLPSNGKYVAGSGAIRNSSSGMTIDQSSSGGIIDWQSFSIGQGKAVQFDNGSGATLNEVTGNNLSLIAGSLKATGSVYLVNPSGIVVASTGRILTQGSFAATTGNATGNIANAGNITSSNGDVTLGGNTVTNSGAVVVRRGGHIWLNASGAANLGGTVSAANANGAGGSIDASGKTIDVTGTLDANGATGGGSIAVGSWSAAAANVSAGAVLTASATQSGNGGHISVVSGNTNFSGTATARGGANGGNGGLIETSGHILAFDGSRIDAGAAHGKDGKWLLDPYDLTVDSTAATAIDNALNANTNVVEQTSTTGTSGYGISSAGTGDIDIDAALLWNTSATLTLDAYHSIDINSYITILGAGGLVLKTNDGGSGGDFFFNNAANVSFTDEIGKIVQGSLTIDGNSYTLVRGIKQLGSDIAADPSGDFALAESFDDSRDGTFTSSPVATTFTGTFEGLGNTISNLSISASGNDIGMFADLGAGGTIRDIGLVNATMTDPNGNDVGPLVGDSSGSIIDSYATGTVGGSDYVGGLVGSGGGSFSSSYATDTVTGVNYVGGLAGQSSGGPITNSYATGRVSGGEYVGGLVGQVGSGSIIDSYATGAISGYDYIGGLVGFDSGNSIMGSYSIGTVGALGYGKYFGGLVGYNDTPSIADSYSTGAVSTGKNVSYVGGLAGYNNTGSITDSYATGAVTGARPDEYIGGLAGYDNTGSIMDSYATGAISGFKWVGGLAGNNSGSISDSYATGSVRGTDGVGGLIGLNKSGSISESYATGAVDGIATNSDNIGGLVGSNLQGTISESWASGAVNGFMNIGGLVGQNVSGTIEDNYADGAVIGDAGSSNVGGLVGYSYGQISDSFATGRVAATGASSVGGVVGYSSGILGDTYWDVLTSGQNTQFDNIVGLTTAQLQGVLPTGFSNTIWGTGKGLYPYFLWQYPTTPQAISGIAYKDAGLTLLASSAAGAEDVFALVNGSSFGSVTTGANGYYYFLVPAGTISDTSAVLAYTGGTTGGARLATGAVALDGNSFDIWGSTLIAQTNDTTYSAAGATTLQSQDATLIADAVGSNATASALVSGLSNYGYIATGSGFTVDTPATLSGGLYIETVAGNAGITVSAPVAISAGSLTLAASGAIAIDQSVNVPALVLSGTGAVTQSAAITAGSLDLLGEGVAYTLTDASNSIGVLAADTGSIALTDGHTLTVGSVRDTDGIAVSGALNLTTEGAGSNFIIGDAVLAGGAMTIISAGTLTENSAGTLDSAALTGSSVGGTTLNGANMIGTLQAFTNSGANGFTLTDGEALTIDGPLDTSGGNIALTTTSGGIAIDAALSAPMLTLTSAGNVTQTSAIRATDLDLLGAGGNYTLTDAHNRIGTLAANTGSIALTDDSTLTVGSVGSTAGVTTAGVLKLKTRGSGSNLLIDDLISTDNTVTLVSAGTLGESGAGALDAAALTGSTLGGAALNGANLIRKLKAFENAGSGSIALTDDETLDVAGVIGAGAGDVTFSTTGANSNLAINAHVTGSTIDLDSVGGDVTEDSRGALIANLLNVSANTGILLTSLSNNIQTVGTDQTNSGPDVIDK